MLLLEVEHACMYVDVLFNLGHVFHMTVFVVDVQFVNGVCDHFTSDGIVCPPNMYGGLLTVAAADNIYYNPMQHCHIKGLFRGAKISLMQQHCSDDFEGNI